MKMAQKLLSVPNIGGGVPGQGMVVEGVKGGIEAPSLLKFTKTAPKKSDFPHIMA
jgi:hypothetical protein